MGKPPSQPLVQSSLLNSIEKFQSFFIELQYHEKNLNPTHVHFIAIIYRLIYCRF